MSQLQNIKRNEGITRTMEQMLGESIIGHVLSNEQSLIAITAITNQICQPLMPQLPHTPCFLLQQYSHITHTNQKKDPKKPNKVEAANKEVQYCKLLWVRPRHLRKLLDCNPLAILKTTFIHNIGSLVTALREYVSLAEFAGGRIKVQEREFREKWSSICWLVSCGRWQSFTFWWLRILFVSFSLSYSEQRWSAATHDDYTQNSFFIQLRINEKIIQTRERREFCVELFFWLSVGM